jgi:hypothetical protein
MASSRPSNRAVSPTLKVTERMINITTWDYHLIWLFIKVKAHAVRASLHRCQFYETL